MEGRWTRRLGWRSDPSLPKYSGLNAVSPERACEEGEIVVLALPWASAEQAVKALRDRLEGKVVVDAMNPIAADFSGLTHGHMDSGARQVANWAPNAIIVKAFNTIGYNIMENPILMGRATTLLVAGDSSDAKLKVCEIAREIGFAPLDVGGLERASLTEASAWLWISLTRSLGRNFVFNFHSGEPS